MKQILVLRRDLGMRKGKMCAQAAHASRYAVADCYTREHVEQWEAEGEPKIVVSASSVEELLQIGHRARQAGLPVGLVQDHGKTELPPGTITALGIGPAPADRLDPLTRHLPLL